MSRRRTLAGAGAVIAGAVGSAWALFNDDGESSTDTEGTKQNTSNETAPQQQSNESNGEAGGNTSEETNTSQNGTQNESDGPEYPEAAEPEANPEVETDNSTINESKAPATEPTPEDLAISATELTTSSSGAAVSGRLTNEADVPITVDLKVTFTENGEQVGRPALGGTTGLEPAETWNFTIRARGSEYSGATDYEIGPVRVSSATR